MHTKETMDATKSAILQESQEVLRFSDNKFRNANLEAEVNSI